MKRAQAAMEFLMTYGWAILVVLVAIGALAYFGVLSPDQFLPEKCTISSGSGLFCEKSSVVGTTGAELISLKIQNSLPEQITLVAATSEITDGTNSCAPAADAVLAADSSTTVDFTAAGGDGTCAALTTTAKIKADISLTLLDADAFSKVTKGQLVTAGGTA